MGLVVTISGLHGTGKTTYAKRLSNHFKLRHVSAGMLFRQIAAEKGLTILELTRLAIGEEEIDRLVDNKTRMEAEKGDVVVDGLLAGWMAREFADVKIYLTSPDDVRVSRIAKREGVSLQEARTMTMFRERVERRRFQKYYGIDIDDVRIYDLIMNTVLLPIESNVEVIRKFIQEYIEQRGGK